MVRSPQHVPNDITDKYEVIEWNHACSILIKDFPDEWEDLLAVLRGFRLLQSHIDQDGGRKSPVADAIDEAFAKSKRWREKPFDIKVEVDGTPHNTPTHKVDYYKNRIAIETEWNNKDPFYDRDLNNFRLLHQLGVISVGVIITRSDDLQNIFNDLEKGDSYGQSTTHIGKLIPRLEGGGAGGCPVLVFAISPKLYVEDMEPEKIAARVEKRRLKKIEKKAKEKQKRLEKKIQKNDSLN